MAKDTSMLQGIGNLSPDANKMRKSTRSISFRDLKRLAQYTGEGRIKMVFLIMAAIISGGLFVVAPVFSGNAIDLMAGKGKVDFESVTRYALVLLAMYAIAAFFSWIVSYYANIIAANTAARLRGEMASKFSRLPVSFFDTHAAGDVLSRFVSDVEAIADGLLQGLLTMFTLVITVSGTLVFMLILSPKMTLVIVPMAAVTVLLATKIAGKTTKHFSSQQRLVGDIQATIEEDFDGQREIKAFGAKKSSIEAFREKNEKLRVSSVRAQFISSLPNPVSRSINHITYVFIGALGYFFGGLTAGGISTFIMYWNNFSRPINDLTNITTQVMAAMASTARVFEILDMPEEKEIEETADSAIPMNFQSDVVFSHVHFSYTPEKPIIRDFNLVVKPGKRVAIIGPTGCGKTTLINLLMRYYDPTSGSITIDGRDITSVSRSRLRNAFGMVLQDTWLLDRSVRDNIAYGKPHATFDEIVAAAKAARAHGFITRLPNGYDTILDRRTNLSSGQRQLLCIARVLIMSPTILILDEATSAVDTLTEKRIVEAFEAMMKGHTSFVIAHRLSTIEGSDIVVDMRNKTQEKLNRE
ncbi:MAG TPA: ABC transporter ATP-binding protein [Bacillota bacterium]|nr:ABC transporter ATP-binding protein [Bacillota bacterium]